MGAAIRQYEAKDFAALHKLDQTCFPAGIAYSKFSLQYFLGLPAADCLVAEDAKRITGFILAETNAPLAHVITLDVAASQRRAGLGSLLLVEMEKHFRFHGVKSVLLETAQGRAKSTGWGPMPHKDIRFGFLGLAPGGHCCTSLAVWQVRWFEDGPMQDPVRVLPV